MGSSCHPHAGKAKTDDGATGEACGGSDHDLVQTWCWFRLGSDLTQVGLRFGSDLVRIWLRLGPIGSGWLQIWFRFDVVHMWFGSGLGQILFRCGSYSV